MKQEADSSILLEIRMTNRMSLLAHSMEFEYLSDVPVLTIDVNEDFKGNEIKSAHMIEKVSDSWAKLKIWNGQIMLLDLSLSK